MPEERTEQNIDTDNWAIMLANGGAPYGRMQCFKVRQVRVVRGLQPINSPHFNYKLASVFFLSRSKVEQISPCIEGIDQYWGIQASIRTFNNQLHSPYPYETQYRYSGLPVFLHRPHGLYAYQDGRGKRSRFIVRESHIYPAFRPVGTKTIDAETITSEVSSHGNSDYSRVTLLGPRTQMSSLFNLLEAALSEGKSYEQRAQEDTVDIPF